MASRRHPGLLWTHNDSGDGPTLYCLRPDGSACGHWRVNGAGATDWEDIAAGPGPRSSESYLYVGDIGDNAGRRPSVVVYRVPEPDIGDRVGAASAGGAAGGRGGTTAPAEALRLRYPDGPHDAEALLVHPATGDLYIVTKGAEPGVYKAAAPLSPSATVVLTLVSRLAAAETILDRITGGDVSPDGRRVILSKYLDGEELELPAGVSAATGFDAIWSRPPLTVDLGARLQGESAAYRLDGRAVLATSEGPGSPLYEVERR